jgi:hypothetical protein
LPVQLIAGGHGPALGEPQAVLAAYLSHRQQREEAILTAMRRGAATVADLVAVVYADTPTALHPLAARSVQAHLVKLTREGKVRHSDGRLQLADIA